MKTSFFTCCAFVAQGCQAFITPAFPIATNTGQQVNSRILCMSENACSRGDAIKGMGVALFSLVAAVAAPVPSLATSTSEVNRKLIAYDIPTVEDAPDGFTSLLETYGNDQNRDPILVGWNYPRGWIVERPNMDSNFEAGTVSTGNYGKGDSAALFVGSKNLLGGQGINTKESVASILKKALAQKGENQFQSFKLKSVKEGATDYAGNKYYIAEFEYELLTGAGFTVERRGVASITQVGKGVQAVLGATTASRAKNVKPALVEIANSFRVYDNSKKK